MAKIFLTDLNLSKNELQNAVIQNLTTAPSTGEDGQIFFNSTSKKFTVYDGTKWVELSSGEGTLTSVAINNATDGGLSIAKSGTDASPIFTIGHTNVLAAAQTTQALYPITVDKNGHITAIGTPFDPNGKQDVIDATHKLSADLVDDTTTTNKFVTAGDKTNWDAKLDSGDNVSELVNDAGYLTEFTETDPIFSASAAAGITAQDITNWNSKQGTLSGSNAIDITNSTVSLIAKENGGIAIDSNGASVDATKLSYEDLQDKIVFETTYDSTSNKAATMTDIQDAIDALPEPMIFKGTVGNGGTIEWENLPTSGDSNIGWTYKVIEDHATAPICKNGDTIISNGTAWVVIPSGDEPSGTVTSITAGEGLTGGTITESGTIALAEVSGLTTGTYNNVTVDKFGRVTTGTNESYVKTYTGTIVGDGTNLEFAFGLSTIGASAMNNIANISIYDGTTGEDVVTDVIRDATNEEIVIGFNNAPALNKTYGVVISYRTGN